MYTLSLHINGIGFMFFLEHPAMYCIGWEFERGNMLLSSVRTNFDSGSCFLKKRLSGKYS
jgi:hypothetical protein